MACLAIRGHETRGKEVIEILKMLGGKNNKYCSGGFLGNIYFINKNGDIETCDSMCCLNYFQLSLGEFLEKFPYKVGDKVVYLDENDIAVITEIKWDNTDSNIYYNVKRINEDDCFWCPPELLKPYKEKTVNHVNNTDVISFDNAQNDIYELDLKDKFHVILREGKYYVERIKPKYPKTFIEVLNFWHPDRQIEDDYQRCYKKDLIENFQDLLYARDAYWKIAGEKMGLDKPWKPIYETLVDNKYFTIQTFNGEIDKCATSHRNSILAFPTEEMRDAFYENFKDLIEECKELL